MPQMQLPLFPDGVKNITSELGFEKRDGQVTYFNGSMPVFVHAENDIPTFRMDREAFLGVLAEVVERYNWICHAFCLMTNHYHLVIETVEGNLSQGMRQLNGVYTQASNRRHGRVGHLFQGRYKAILVDGDAYLLELTRYVVLNPVRAGRVEHPEEWLWSSYQAMTGQRGALPWLATDGLLAQFSTDRAQAISRYAQFVGEGIQEESIWKDLNRQIFLGDEDFVARMQAMNKRLADTVGVPRAQRRPPPPPLAVLAVENANRDEVIVAAYATGEYSYQEIAEFFGLHFTTVGKIVRAARSTDRGVF